MHIERGQVFMLFLDPAFGHEIGGYKVRPVVVVSIDELTRRGFVVGVVPGTSANGRTATASAALVKPTANNGLRNDTLFQAHQIRSIDQGRFVGPPLGRVSVNDMLRIEAAMRFSLGLP